jgi:hypothetical protein
MISAYTLRFKGEKMRNRRFRDPYIDRRSAEDRRLVYDAGYWDRGGLERRSATDRRKPEERRASYVKVSKWSSVCAEDTAGQRRLR